jgi:hypothetical protein
MSDLDKLMMILGIIILLDLIHRRISMDNLREILKRMEADLPLLNNLLYEAVKAEGSDNRQAIWHLQQIRQILDKWITYLNASPVLVDVIEG